MTKLGVIADKHWMNRRKLQKVLSDIKSRVDSPCILAAGGKEPFDAALKKYTIDFGITYTEYNPSFSGYNLYSAMTESYYNKSYHFSQLFHRMTMLVRNCDYLIILSETKKLDPITEHAKKQAIKQDISFVFLS